MKLILLITAGILGGLLLKPVATPLFEAGQSAVITVTPTPTPKRSEVIAYIAKKFEPEGPQVMVKAIECFYSESGLRWNAVNTNKNGTHDGGVAQINDVHNMTLDQRLDYQKNIDAAYDIYKASGFNAWYGKLCR